MATYIVTVGLLCGIYKTALRSNKSIDTIIQRVNSFHFKFHFVKWSHQDKWPASDQASCAFSLLDTELITAWLIVSILYINSHLLYASTTCTQYILHFLDPAVEKATTCFLMQCIFLCMRVPNPGTYRQNSSNANQKKKLLQKEKLEYLQFHTPQCRDHLESEVLNILYMNKNQAH